MRSSFVFFLVTTLLASVVMETPVGVAATCTNAQFVKVVGPGTMALDFRQMEVFAGSTNVASGGTASQVTTATGNVASNCIDGSTAHCITTSVASPWWEVNLGSTHCIDTIAFYNYEGTTGFTAPELLKGGSVIVYDASHTALHTYTIAGEVFELYHVNSAPGTSARYVRIDAARSLMMSMREVLVITGSGTNVASSGTASQGPSTSGSKFASFCIDGNTVHDVANLCQLDAHADTYWEVDLGSTTDLARVVVYNRLDAYNDNLERNPVILLDANRKPVAVKYLSAGRNTETVHFATQPHCGIRYVRVENGKADNMQMQELMLFNNGVNIALGKTATQSSTPGTNVAANCVDGNPLGSSLNTGPIYSACRTDSGYAQWWEVDLGSDQCADFVHTYASQGYWAEMNDAAIILLDSNRVPLNSFENDFQEVQTLGIINPSWDGSPVAGCKTARYLRIDRTNADNIAITEMQIWAGLINIGLVSKLLDSSAPNVADNSKDRAVNGGLWISGWQGFRSTAIAGAYWELDFGKDYCVDRVVWYGHTTLISEQEGCTIHLMDSGRVDVQTWLPTLSQPVAVYLVDGVSASDEVRAFVLKNNRADWFQYREFQVMKSGVNIALNQVTSQNDVSLTRSSDIAVDGDTSQTLFAQCAGASQWHHFNLFLSQTYSSVDSVFIHNFLDLTTRIRMDTGGLIVLDGNFIPTKTLPLTRAAVSYFNLTSAAKPNCGVRYVRVQAHSDHQFQELRAYGGGVNLALGKTVSQTTDLNGDTPASVCTDNYLDFVSPYLICASTATADAYWELDFGSDVCLDFIHFVSRNYVASPNEWGSVLLLDSNQLPIQSFTLGGNDQENFIVNEAYHPTTTGCVEARYLRIERLTADYLALEEIMVFSGPLNVALGKSITSSSVLTHPMEQCVDGTYGPAEAGRICHTQSSATEWIEVDFGQSYCVSHVVLYSQGTQLQRLDNCQVTLLPDGKATTAAEWNSNGDYVQIFYPSSVTVMNSTRFVRVEMAKHDYLHMREVETWMSGSNVALSKNGAQYNDLTVSHVAGKALDGVKLPSESSITHTGASHRVYWQVDLAASYDLDSVLIYNRVLAPERLLGSSLVLLNEHHVPIRSYGLTSYFLQPLALVAQEPQMCGIRYVRIEIGQNTALWFNEIIVASDGKNIALGKTANYDTNHASYPPSRCVNGIPGWGTHTDFLCHSGVTNRDIYYEIDLGADYCVDYAHIINRWDSPAQLASSAIMFLSNIRQPLRVSHFTSKYEQWVPINTSTELGHPGCVNSQYVRFQGNTGTYILVNEIQAYEGHANVAMGKTVTMSGFEGGFHDGCMDGTTRDNYGAHCQAQATANNWMMIDLGREYCINKVVISSHKTYVSDRFANNDVLLLDSSSSAVRTWPSISAQHMAIFDADNIPKNNTIRYVQVQVAGNTYIALREVKVIRDGVNIATSGTAHMSTLGFGHAVASVCIDGSTLHGAGVYCHSTLSFDSWFVIDLGQEYDGIDAVLVYPYRSVDYAANAGVMLFNELWVPQRSFTMKGATGVEIFYVNEAAAEANCGIRYVRVEIGKTEILNFMELEVYSNQVNVAKDKPATQSADATAAYVASNCADGYRDRNATFATAGEGTMCHTLSSLDAWWEVDLQADYCVDYADFFGDYGSLNRLDGATVQFLNSNREAVRLFRLEPIAVNRMMLNASYRETPQEGCQMGRYVRIERSGVAGYIVAVELEVYEGDFNVALGKTTTVSVLAGGGYLERYATDGLTATDHTLLAVYKAHTTTAVDAWLEVDLGQEYCVDHIVWYCQVGYAASKKAGTTMKLLDTARATVKTWTPYLDPRDTSGNAYMDAEVFHVSPPRNETAYIQAKQGIVNDQVVLREVQGWSGGVNVAEGKRSYQYNDLNAGVKAAKCNDGSYADTETCQTTASYRNWWEVDLGGSFTLDRVMVFAGEAAAFQTKMDGTDIILFNARRVPIRTYNAYKAGVTPLQVAEEAPLGCGVRYLTLQTSLSSAISMGEILAFKDGVNYATAAHGATITSSTTDGSNTAAKCIDGVRISALSPHLSTCTTLTGLNEQIEVDLGQERCIDAVELVNREDYKVHWQHSHILLAQSGTREIRSAFPVRELASERFLTNRNWRPQGNTGCQTARKVCVERTTADVLSFTQWQVIVGGTNVALGLPCTKSSAHANDNADFCGVTDGSQWRANGYYAYTASSATEWIELDLQEDYCIDSIVMTGPQSAGVAYQANLVLKDSSDVTVKTMPFTGDGTTWVQHFFMNETSADTAYTRNGRFVMVRPDGAVALQLREVVVERNGTNLATAGTAGQATDSGSSTANCNDGDTTTAAFCLTTATVHSQYVLDLGSTKTDIDSITVYNSHSVTPANLAKAFVFLINEEGSIIRSSMLTTSALTQWSLGNTDVTPLRTCGFRYIRVDINANAAMGLSEVYVIAPDSRVNLAIGKTATQSSTASEGGGQTYGPQVCNDGVNTTVSSPEEACLTTASWDAYWMVDLGKEECVEEVVIYNRAGSYTTGGIVSLLSSGSGLVRNFEMTSAQVQILRTDTEPYIMATAQYVQVLVQSGTLHMREVEIFSGLKNAGLLFGPHNKWMSSIKSPPNADGSGPEICVNGDTVSQAGNAVCQTQTGDNQYWSIDFAFGYCLNQVKVFNRIDANAAALDRATLLFFNSEWRLEEAHALTSAAEQEVFTSTRGLCTPTVSGSLSVTKTVSPPPTPTPTITASSTLSITETRSPTATEPITKSASISRSLSPSSTVSAAPSLSITKTITPPPTPTPTFSPTMTGTKSLSLTPSLSLTESQTLSDSHSLSRTGSISQTDTESVSISATPPLTGTGSLPLTDTLPETTSESFSLSTTPDFYCGRLQPSVCALQVGVCNLTDESSCYYSRCESLPDDALCLKHGCHWVGGQDPAKPGVNCTKPPECRDMPNADLCDAVSQCRWTGEFCKPDLVPCSTLVSQSKCMGAECSWNSLSAPPCFRMIRNPALCRLVRDKGTCEAHRCLWISATSRCERWDLTCEEMAPSPATCPEISRCFFYEKQQKCVSLDSLTLDSVFGVFHPPGVFPAEKFNLLLYGVPLSATNDIAVIDRSKKTECPIGDDYFNEPLLLHADTYDSSLSASVVYDVALYTKGNYSFCVKLSDSTSAGPFSILPVDTPVPSLTACSAQPVEPFAKEFFTVVLTGSGLDPDEGRFVVLSVNDTNGVCPPFNTSIYRKVASHANRESTVRYKVTDGGEYILCYVNRGKVAVTCPKLLGVLGVPPWHDPIVLAELAEKAPKFDALNPIDLNRKFCKGVPNLNATGGILAHPSTYEIMFGDGKSSYPSSSVCVFPITPLDMPAISGQVGALVLAANYVSLQKNDVVRVFAPNDNLFLTFCPVFSDPTTCRQQLCWWDEATVSCSSPSGTAISNCPRQLADYTLFRVISYEIMLLAEDDKMPLPLPMDGGGIVVICTEDSPTPPVGVGASLTYRTQETYCLNDCKDSKGTAHGICVSNELFQRECRCNFGWRGVDCSQPANCPGVGLRASVIKAAHGVETIALEQQRCANLYVVDPTRRPPSTPAFSRMQTFAIGMSFSDLSLTVSAQDAKYGDTCNNSYIEVREESHIGKVLKRLCPSDSATGEVLRIVLPEATSIYVEMLGAAATDTVTMEYTAVSTVCPGVPGPSGVPESSEEICEDRGTCVPLEYSVPATLPDSLYECACRLPWASSYVGGSCDTCAFGYIADSFPECLSALSCARNCSGNGDCIDGVCWCNKGWYGLDCTLIDDKERLGPLEPSLQMRVPLNGQDAGNVLQSGRVDRTMTDCSMKGSNVPCRMDGRKNGRNFAQEENSIYDSVSESSAFDLFGRRQAASNVTNSSNSSIASLDANKTDEGLALNTLATRGSYPQFVRSDNVSADVEGSFSIVGWVKVSALTKGFLFAKTDSSFYADGRSPVLEKAQVDIQDRTIPLHKMRLLDEPVAIHLAVFFNGPQKRVDLMITRPDMRNKTTEKEDWLWVRHFRLGTATAGKLFDGSWRHFALKVLKTSNRNEAQVYVDGFTKTAHSDFVQCVPWLPKLFSSDRSHVNSSNPNVVVQYPGVSFWWGYHFRGSVDELHVYSKALTQRAIINIGGPEFLKELFVSTSALILLSLLCCMCLLVAVLLIRLRWARSTTTTDEDAKEGDEEQHDEEPAADGDDENGDECRASGASPEEMDGGEPQPTSEATLVISDSQVVIPSMSGSTSPRDPPKKRSTKRLGRFLGVSTRAETPVADHDDSGLPTAASSDDVAIDMDNWSDASFGEDEIQEAAEDDPSDLLQNAILNVTTEIHMARQEALAARNSAFEAANNELAESGGPHVVEVDPHTALALSQKSNTNQSIKRLTLVERKLRVMSDLHGKAVEAIQDKLTQGESRRNAHLKLLTDLVDVVEAAAKKERAKRQAKSAGKGLGAIVSALTMSCTSSGRDSEVPLIMRPFVEAFQLLGQLAGALNFPPEFQAVFGALALTFSCDFVQAYGVPFAGMFYFTVTVSCLAFLALFVLQVTSRPVKKKELASFMKTQLVDRLTCIADDVPYKEKGELKEKIARIASLVLAIFYMPLTQQAIQAVFCHRSIMCEFDCYSDPSHKSLVTLGIVMLCLISLGAPILYIVSIRRILVMYQYYIETFDHKLQAQYWKAFVTSYRTPMNSQYDRYQFHYAYFEVVIMMFKAMMCFFAMSMTPETLTQLICVIILQVFFLMIVVWTRPFIEEVGNRVMAAAHAFLVTLLMLQCVSLLQPDSPSIGIIMVVLTFGIIFYITANVVKAGRDAVKAAKEEEEGLEKEENKWATPTTSPAEHAVQSKYATGSGSDDDEVQVHHLDVESNDDDLQSIASDGTKDESPQGSPRTNSSAEEEEARAHQHSPDAPFATAGDGRSPRRGVPSGSPNGPAPMAAQSVRAPWSDDLVFDDDALVSCDLEAETASADRTENEEDNIEVSTSSH